MPLRESAGDQLGAYTLLNLLGEGGMGRVWCAEQVSPIRRKVAIKVIKPGLDSEQVLARFEAERQALARMEHPNIARVLDAGTTGAGRPFFVMELVEGPPITQFCTQRQLSFRDRLSLFASVCRAIQHAHQKGVLHRDIKPGNVLVAEVDGGPVPKVIDFGVAKAIDQPLTEHTLFTQFGALLGTPEYMSPEQASRMAADVDTRSDVYSLGVLLYELLTGRTPLDRTQLREAGFDEVLRRIREDEPERPSQVLARADTGSQRSAGKPSKAPTELLDALRGDLDWLILKAIEKDRDRRYQTARELLGDVERFLEGEPIHARPPSGLYRVGKLVRRHRVAAAGAAAVVLSLTLGLAASTAAWIRERDARERAVASEEHNRQFAAFLVRMLEGVGPAVALGRDTTLLREVLDGTDRQLQSERFTHPAVEAELSLALARVYHDIAAFDAAEISAQRSLSLLQGLPEADPIRTTDALLELARARLGAGRFPEAEATAKECFQTRHRAWGDAHPAVAEARAVLGEVILRRDRPKEAEAELRAAVASWARSGRTNDLRWAGVHGSLAESITAQGETRYADAMPVFEQTLSLARQNLGIHPQTARILNDFGELRVAQRHLGEGEALLQEAVQMRRKLLGDTHPDVALSLYLLSDALLKQGKFDEATHCTEPFLTPETSARPESVHLRRTRARIQARRSEFQAAAEDYWKILELEPGNHWHYLQSAPLYAELGDWNRYRILSARALEKFRGTADHTIAERMAKATLLEPDVLPDRETVDQWTATALRAGADHQYLPYIRLARGLFELRQGHWNAAADYVEKTLANTGPSVAGLRDIQAWMVLAMARHRLGQLEQARSAFAEGQAAWEKNRLPREGDLLSSWHEVLYARILTREAGQLIR